MINISVRILATGLMQRYILDYKVAILSTSTCIETFMDYLSELLVSYGRKTEVN